MSEDPFDLQRFVNAQAGVFDTALAELRAGRKRTHWMWFVFPQLRGLGRSATAARYGITGSAEARAYLAHPVLGARLREAVRALSAHAGKAPAAILGSIDALKLRSCLTLFEAVSGEPAFATALDRFHDGERCPLTLERLADGPGRDTRASP